VSRIEDYTRVLWQWNENLNLTRHTTYDLFVARDLLDSLRLAELLEPGETVLDVGTGGGVPGVILAIVRPDLEVALCESVAKRARAVDDMVGQLGLSVPVHAMRAEELLTSISFGTLVLRAVAPLPKMLNWFRGRFSSVGRLLIIKGPAWVEERGEARHRGLLAGLRLRVVSRYPIPGRDSESVILEIRPESSD
jgi:16S rRNA (guanine527-N7)-methyltransferase